MSFVRLELEGEVAAVTLDHPGGNRVNFQMREDIHRAFEQVGVSNARVLLVKGAGVDFCLGGDIRDWPGIAAVDLRPRVEIFADAIDVLERLSIPTIAVVQGGCMGGGFELAMGCDFIIAAKSAKFRFPEALLGIMTLQGGVYQLAERIGHTKALELVFLSESIDADQMAAWNVVNEVVDDSSLQDRAQAFAARLARGPTDAYARTKRLMRIWRDHGRVEARRQLYEISMPVFDTPTVQAALRSAADAVKEGHSVFVSPAVFEDRDP